MTEAHENYTTNMKKLQIFQKWWFHRGFIHSFMLNFRLFYPQKDRKKDQKIHLFDAMEIPQKFHRNQASLVSLESTRSTAYDDICWFWKVPLCETGRGVKVHRLTARFRKWYPPGKTRFCRSPITLEFLILYHFSSDKFSQVIDIIWKRDFWSTSWSFQKCKMCSWMNFIAEKLSQVLPCKQI